MSYLFSPDLRGKSRRKRKMSEAAEEVQEDRNCLVLESSNGDGVRGKSSSHHHRTRD